MPVACPKRLPEAGAGEASGFDEPEGALDAGVPSMINDLICSRGYGRSSRAAWCGVVGMLVFPGVNARR